ncbi:pyruvate dehydrogenase (acetyl-transferring) E1 component subunit alpha [Candidatus Micrarchaeota archaeon]|nr:pyruvate dehydrogenase (acetyl-transferring) E1 component subunit alpha [Candidatus Micrarchaeota archaeon]MBU1930178.1 pyruvate dehydrogenase (acetyl-transferring) E1 component subunit alpha [Candidatus Micrarchaeota archaeon]
MAKKTVFSGKVEFVQVLDKDGKADKTLLPKLSKEELKQLYRWMVFARIADEKCLKLQRAGRIGTFAQILGQEAQVGVALALKKNDWLVPSFRENALIWALGAKAEDIYQLFGGFEKGQQFSGLNILPISVPVGTHPLHAVGIAWAFKLRNEKKVVATFFGDGATSEGDFHEALNFASVFQVPCVFFCQNNQYAISVPRKKQSHAQTLAQKGLAYGMDGIQVDGNDVLAVYRVARTAIEKARFGGGPTLVELVTYRMADHTTADDATKYRTKTEVEYWKKRDPILRMQHYLKTKRLWTEKWEDTLGIQIRSQIEKSVQIYEALSQPQVGEMFDFLFEKKTPELEQQKNKLQNWKNQEEGKV